MVIGLLCLMVTMAYGHWLTVCNDHNGYGHWFSVFNDHNGNGHWFIVFNGHNGLWSLVYCV